MTARWRYIVPSLLTCFSILAGLLAISEASADRYQSSAWFVMLCVLLDKADGTAARLLKASSRFGMELDSLSDFLTFGVAPAVMVALVLTRGSISPPQWMAGHFTTIVYISCGLWTITTALRLAKFNVKTGGGDTHFLGAPSTVCGGFVASYYLTVDKYQLPVGFLHAMPMIMIALALLMVSNRPLRKVGLRKSLVFNITLLSCGFFVYLFGLLRVFPEYLFVTGNLYLWIGLIWATVTGIRPGTEDNDGDQAAEFGRPQG